MTRSVSFIEPSPLHPFTQKKRMHTVLLKALLNYFCFKCCQTDMVKSCHFMGSTLTSFEELAWTSIDIFVSGIRYCKTNQLLFLSRFLQQSNSIIPVGEGNVCWPKGKTSFHIYEAKRGNRLFCYLVCSRGDLLQ